MDSAMEPAAKLRRRNRRRSTTGWASVSSQTMNTARLTTATMASMTIRPEANQSSSLPLSSMSCSAPTHSTSRASPRLSMGSLRTGVSRLR